MTSEAYMNLFIQESFSLFPEYVNFMYTWKMIYGWLYIM